MGKGEPKPLFAKVNKQVFVWSVFACLIFYGPMIVFQDSAQALVDKCMHVITYSTDWVWEFVVFGCLVFLAWLAIGRYGRVKLGEPDDKPEFSTFTWVAMMFCGGTGGALVNWSLTEPIYYLQGPPFWIEPFSPQAAQYALAYGIFHWGFSAWATFALPAVTFAYLYYVRKQPHLSASNACRGVLGDWVDKWPGTVINALVVIGLVGGMATALGFIVPMISRVTADYFGFEDSVAFKVLVCLILAIVYGWSCYKGLKSGIAKLADFNMYLTFALLAFVAIVGPTMFLFSLLTDNFGVLLHDFVRMSFNTDPISKSGFPQGWTVFYWAWWLAWSIYVGLFAARISKGRTIRGLIFNMIFSATACCVIFFMILGGFQVDQIMNQGVDLGSILSNEGQAAVVSNFLSGLPFKAVVIPFFIIVMVISTATGTDAASFTLANMTCSEVRDGVEPPKWNRIFWAAMLFFASTGLLLVGGMNVVQLSSVLTAVPELVLLVIFAISTVKWLREDFGSAPLLTTDKYKDSSISYDQQEEENSDTAEAQS